MEKYFEHKNLLSPPIKRAAYSDRTAWMMAEFSRLSYESPADIEKNLSGSDFKLKKMFINEKTDTEGFLIEGSKFAILVFRGTEKQLKDIKTDMKFKFKKSELGYKIHSGFLRSFKSVEENLKKEIDALGDETPIYITGHSLGGALAIIATAFLQRDNIAACYTFGSPKLSEGSFADYIKIPIYRVRNYLDPVPNLPMWQKHVGNTFLLTEGGRLRSGEDGFFPNLGFWVGRFYKIKTKFTDHSIANYCKKLAAYALSRNG